MESPSERLTASLLDHVGGSLRAVIAYRTDGYEILYMPGDVEDAYSDEELDTVYAELLFETAGTDYKETLYHLGEMEADVRLFETATLVNVMPVDDAGLLVSVGADVDPNVREITRICRRWMTGLDGTDPLSVVQERENG